MKKIIVALLLFTLHSQARYEASPSRTCPAYNNMKHTRNSHDATVDPGKKYTVLDDHKGQKLILLKGEQPAQRWVDGACFEKSDEGSVDRSKPNKTDMPSGTVGSISGRARESLLALSWHNAFCELHRSRKECRRGRHIYLADNRFVLHGLWPQPRESLYCDVPSRLKQLDRNRQWNRLPNVPLSEETRQELLRVMPGVASGLHRHEWIKHGSCSGEEPEAYFKKAIDLTRQVNDSKVRYFFVANTGRVVTIGQIRFKVDESFGKGSGKRVEMRCRKGMITELWFHLGGEGDKLSTLLEGGKKSRSRCRKGRIDSAGFR